MHACIRASPASKWLLSGTESCVGGIERQVYVYWLQRLPLVPPQTKITLIMSFMTWLITRKKPRLLSELAMVWGLWKLRGPLATAQCGCFTSHWALLDRNFTLPCLPQPGKPFFDRRKNSFFIVLQVKAASHPSFYKAIITHYIKQKQTIHLLLIPHWLRIIYAAARLRRLQGFAYLPSVLALKAQPVCVIKNRSGARLALSTMAVWLKQ